VPYVDASASPTHLSRTPGMPRRSGVQVPCGRDDANHKSKATASPRGGVGRKLEHESMTRRTETAYKARRLGASQLEMAKPVVIKRPLCKCGGCVEKVAWLIPGGLHGCPRYPVFDHGAVRDCDARESVVRCGEVSRGRSTGGIDDRREGPNAKPRCRTPVLAERTSKAANPARGLDGRAGG
jgi:hypothetical protein